MNLLQSWNPATMTALAAILGSLAGALGSSLSAWISQRHQDRRELLAKKISLRERLYSDFIRESAQAVFDATQNTFQDPDKLIPTYSLLSRIRLIASTSVVESAEQVVTTILTIYSEPNLTPEQIRFRAAKHEDPLRDFSNTCRHELESLWNLM